MYSRFSIYFIQMNHFKSSWDRKKFNCLIIIETTKMVYTSLHRPTFTRITYVIDFIHISTVYNFLTISTRYPTFVLYTLQAIINQIETLVIISVHKYFLKFLVSILTLYEIIVTLRPFCTLNGWRSSGKVSFRMCIRATWISLLV